MSIFAKKVPLSPIFLFCFSRRPAIAVFVRHSDTKAFVRAHCDPNEKSSIGSPREKAQSGDLGQNLELRQLFSNSLGGQKRWSPENLRGEAADSSVCENLESRMIAFDRVSGGTFHVQSGEF